MKKDDIKTLIVVIVVCSFCVGLVLILNHKSNSEKLESVSDYNTFFSTYNYVTNYINSIASGNSNSVYNLLYSEYIIDNNITIDNVLDYVDDISSEISLKVKDMKYVKIKNNYLYYVKGSLIKEDFDTSSIYDDDYEVILVYDYDTLTYSVYPILDSKANKIIDSIKKISIIVNNDNKIKETELIKKEKICSLYLSDYINYIYKDIDKAYELLSDDMKKKEFTSIDKFKDFIIGNSNNISSLADKCSLDNIDDKRKYTVIDKNNNRYIFTEESIMNYKVDIYIND